MAYSKNRPFLTMLLLSSAAALIGFAPQARADVFEMSSDGQWKQVNKNPAEITYAVQNEVETAETRLPAIRLAAITTLGEPIAQPVIEQKSFAITAAPATGNYAPVINAAAQQYGISPALIDAVMWQESRYNQNAVSSAGAIGLMQLMPGTARQLGVNPADPWQNVFGGTAYLRQQLDRFNNNVPLALAAYNSGPGNVIKHGGVPPFTETRNYVHKIVERLKTQAR
jgi:soluble lytic murein transglycosylase-like protein